MAASTMADRPIDLMALLAPTPADDAWEADKAGWRAFVMGHSTSGYRAGSRLQAAWQQGYDAASRSNDAIGLML